MGRWVHTALLLAALIGPVAFAHAQSDAVDAEQTDLADLQAEMERLRADNEAIRREVGELRALTADEWLTERRAEEIRAIVEDVLLDSEVRTSLSDSGLMAGWSDHFFLASADGRFKLELQGMLQVRWMLNHQHEQDKYRYGFDIPRAKLTFRGHVFDRSLTYLMRLDVAQEDLFLVNGSQYLQDAWIRYEFDDEWSIRAGQFKLPFMREELVSSAYQLAVDRSLVAHNMSVGRSQGIEVKWNKGASTVAFAYSDAGTDNFGGFNSILGTQPMNSPALLADTEFTGTMRIEHLFAGSWAQFADLTSPPTDTFGMLLGVAAHYQREESGTAVPRRARQFALTTDLSLEFGGANVFASFTWHYIESAVLAGTNIDVYGAVVQGGVYLSNKVELFARWEWGEWDIDPIDVSDMSTLTVGLIYYIDGHDLKWTTDVGVGLTQIESLWSYESAGWRFDPDGEKDQIVVRTQFQLLF